MASGGDVEGINQICPFGGKLDHFEAVLTALKAISTRIVCLGLMLEQVGQVHAAETGRVLVDPSLECGRTRQKSGFARLEESIPGTIPKRPGRKDHANGSILNMHTRTVFTRISEAVSVLNFIGATPVLRWYGTEVRLVLCESYVGVAYALYLYVAALALSRS